MRVDLPLEMIENANKGMEQMRKLTSKDGKDGPFIKGTVDYPDLAYLMTVCEDILSFTSLSFFMSKGGLRDVNLDLMCALVEILFRIGSTPSANMLKDHLADLLTAMEHSPEAVDTYLQHQGFFIGVVSELVNRLITNYSPSNTQKDAAAQTQIVGSFGALTMAKKFFQVLLGKKDEEQIRWDVKRDVLLNIMTKHGDDVDAMAVLLKDLWMQAASLKSAELSPHGDWQGSMFPRANARLIKNELLFEANFNDWEKNLDVFELPSSARAKSHYPGNLQGSVTHMGRGDDNFEHTEVTGTAEELYAKTNVDTIKNYAKGITPFRPSNTSIPLAFCAQQRVEFAKGGDCKYSKHEREEFVCDLPIKV